MKRLIPVVGLLFLSACCSPKAPTSGDAGSVEIVPASEVEWQKLNPARGDKSPQAATLWGDRSGEVPTGFLAKFVDGFSSPPHIHNATYRAVVLEGLIHNDDPDAELMWMPPGSFWTQPKGEVHITSAKGESSVALVEIDQGPYLVLSVNDRFDEGERPINMVPNNVVWVETPGFSLDEASPQSAYLWGSLFPGHPNGTFLKLPAGFEGELHSDAEHLRAVVIQGELHLEAHEGAALIPGSYIGSFDRTRHQIHTDEEVILYIRTLGRYSLFRTN